MRSRRVITASLWRRKTSGPARRAIAQDAQRLVRARAGGMHAARGQHVQHGLKLASRHSLLQEARAVWSGGTGYPNGTTRSKRLCPAGTDPGADAWPRSATARERCAWCEATAGAINPLEARKFKRCLSLRRAVTHVRWPQRRRRGDLGCYCGARLGGLPRG